MLYDEVRDISDDLPWIDQLLRGDSPPINARAAQSLKYHVARTMYQAGDHLSWLIPMIPDPRVKLSIRETGLYFDNHHNIGCHIRQLQKSPLREAASKGECVLLIGHSMGSIIAYDALWELDHLEGVRTCVDQFLTIGSPLGMNYVQKRLAGRQEHMLRRYPCNIGNWVNISSQGDLVALDPSLANDFDEMVKNKCVSKITDIQENILNQYRDHKGLNVHKSYGYLVNPAVATVIADWWKAA